MAKTDRGSAGALEWLRYVLNPDTTEMPTIEDWPAIIAFADKQKLLGVCLPEFRPANLEKQTLLRWVGMVQVIEQQNRLLNKRVEQLVGMLEKDGFRCCMLKGQGNAMLYPNPLMRCSGDIDMWIDADEKSVYQYVKRLFPDEKESFKHIHFPIFEDVSVDVHTTPLKFYNTRYARRLTDWIEQNKAEQFAHRILLPGIEGEVSVPTGRFNAVYQLGHMLIHTFDEGLGLRQVVDYFYVLRGLGLSADERGKLVETIQSLGMYRFARGMMWIENAVLGLPSALCLVEPDKRIGLKLLGDMMEGGNFGHYSERYRHGGGFYRIGLSETWRIFTLLPMAPREGLVRICSKLKTAVRHVGKKLKGKC